MRNESRQFAYWSLVLDIDMLHCRFVRSVREGYLFLFLTKPITPVGFRFM